MTPITPTGATSLHTALLAVIAVVLVGFALKAADIVFVPLVLSGFLTLIVAPIVQWLQRRVPRRVALTIVLAFLLSGLALVWLFLTASLELMMERGPLYVERIDGLVDRVLSTMARRGIRVRVEELPAGDVLRFGVDVVVASMSPLVTLTLVGCTLVMMLIESDQLAAKFRRSLRQETSADVYATARSVIRLFQRFFVVKTWISAVTGVLATLYLYLLGVDFAFVWGTLAFLLTFIPNVGAVISVVPPTAVALLQFPNPTKAVAVLAGLTLLKLTIGNFYDPRVMGRSLSLSPLVVFTAMVFWGWLWGIPGVFLAVPLTVLAKLILEHVDGLRPLAIALGDAIPAPAHSPPQAPE